jgi:hypothetical protein
MDVSVRTHALDSYDQLSPGASELDEQDPT